MNMLVTDSEVALRLTVFLSVLTLLAVMELLFPRRSLILPKASRWFTNISISVINVITIRIVVPIAGVASAVFAQEQGWGLFNVFDIPSLLGILIFLLLFDLTIYFQHRLFHIVPLLWRFHRVHHTDLDYDVTTGNRFHPLSILVSSVIKIALVFLLGPSVVAIIVAEVLLNATSMFNHSNLKLPFKLDSLLRIFIVTPDMHRIHHSVDEKEHNRNFGFNFPWWDRLFGSYLDQASEDQQSMKIGIKEFQDPKLENLSGLLLQPFRHK